MIDKCNICVHIVQFWSVIKKINKKIPALSVTSRGIRRIRNAFLLLLLLLLIIMNQTFLSKPSLGCG